jgi:ABC-type transporter lipoprotein component MlaA
VQTGGEGGLFDLASDIGESKDLSKERPEVRQDLDQTFAQWNSQMAEPIWTLQRAAPKTTKKAAKKKA